MRYGFELPVCICMITRLQRLDKGQHAFSRLMPESAVEFETVFDSKGARKAVRLLLKITEIKKFLRFDNTNSGCALCIYRKFLKAVHGLCVAQLDRPIRARLAALPASDTPLSPAYSVAAHTPLCHDQFQTSYIPQTARCANIRCRCSPTRFRP